MADNIDMPCTLECEALIPAPTPYALDVLAPPHCAQVRLTTLRAESSQGLPVVVLEGIAYGPADLGAHRLIVGDLTAYLAAGTAGYTVVPSDSLRGAVAAYLAATAGED